MYVEQFIIYVSKYFTYYKYGMIICLGDHFFNTRIFEMLGSLCPYVAFSATINGR